ncbi:MAG TPA: hypothetical protein P5181_06125 [Dermatophilaceae bacterium]|nr:hypothetical protein [Dermatophilaceae bacterium]
MGKGGKAGKPKKKCCESRPRCDRCPIVMLREGRLPEGWTVHRRRLVKTDKVSKDKRAKG